jgi:plasmid stability protein
VNSITISNLDSQLFELLSVAADVSGRSMEEEARMILGRSLNQKDCMYGLGTRIQNRFKSDGGVELHLPVR